MENFSRLRLRKTAVNPGWTGDVAAHDVSVSKASITASADAFILPVQQGPAGSQNRLYKKGKGMNFHTYRQLDPASSCILVLILIPGERAYTFIKFRL